MKKIDLPRPTSFCDEAPVIKFTGSDIHMFYVDGESGDTVEIFLQSVYGFSYVELEYISTLDYEHGCVEIEESNWKEQFLQSWEARERKREEAFGKESNIVKHFRFYFDEYGMYDILCKNIQVN